MSIPAMSDTSGSTLPRLLERVRARDPEGWRRFVQLYSPLVYYWCRKAGLQPADAADVMQEVFQSVLAGVAEFRNDRPGDTLNGWLWTIARNKLRDHFRRAKAQPEAAGGADGARDIDQAEVDISDELNATNSPAMVSLLHRALRVLQNEFETKTWQAFWQVTIEGQRPAEVAADLHISTNAVYKAKSRVLARLREELGDRLG